MVDLDGSFEYSEIISVRKNCDRLREAQINTTDMLGRLVRTFSLEFEKEWNTSSLDISDLPAETYNVQIEGKKNSKILIIQ